MSALSLGGGGQEYHAQIGVLNSTCKSCRGGGSGQAECCSASKAAGICGGSTIGFWRPWWLSTALRSHAPPGVGAPTCTVQSRGDSFSITLLITLIPVRGVNDGVPKREIKLFLMYDLSSPDSLLATAETFKILQEGGDLNTACPVCWSTFLQMYLPKMDPFCVVACTESTALLCREGMAAISCIFEPSDGNDRLKVSRLLPQNAGYAERKAGQELAAELLEAVLKLQESKDSHPEQILPYLLVRTSQLRSHPMLLKPAHKLPFEQCFTKRLHWQSN